MYKGTFHCYFGAIKDYPFEEQSCNFNVYPAHFYGPFKLVAQDLKVHDRIQPGMDILSYKIVEWKMETNIISIIEL